MNGNTLYPAAIIGAGPIGLEIAAALKQLEIPYLHLDKSQIGQMIYDFPPGIHFFSSNERIAIAGIPIQTAGQQKCTREEYLAYLRVVAGAYQLQVCTYACVEKIAKESGSFRIFVATAGGSIEYQAKNIILATGGTSKPRRLNVPGESLPHVSIKMEDPHKYFQKKVLIVGGKNSAVESALRCYHAGAKTAIATRRQEFNSTEIKYWLLPELQGCIAKNQISCGYAVEVKEIQPDKVILKSLHSGEVTAVGADFVIKAIGFEANMDLFKGLGVTLDPESSAPVFDPLTMETDVPGVYAAGTVTAGTQKKFKVFLENCHQHVEKICSHLCMKLGIKAGFEELSRSMKLYRSSGSELEE